MGKKDKSSQKSSQQSSTSLINHSELPQDQKRSWVIKDDLIVLKEYMDLLVWMREWGCKEGSDFKGIRSLKCVTGFPLIEVSVSGPDLPSKKFLISRMSLYILAFHCDQFGWLVFKDDELKLKFSETSRTLERNPSYSVQPENPWAEVGAKSMIVGLQLMDSVKLGDVCRGCEIFMVHLCEAARLRLVELSVSRTLVPVAYHLPSDYNESDAKKVGNPGSVDIFNLLAPFRINLTGSVFPSPQVEPCIKKFKQLCKTWYEYCLSGDILSELAPEIADECGVPSPKTLYCCLCVLCNTNLNKIRMEWEKKVTKRKCPPNFTEAEFQHMQSIIRDLVNY